MSELERMLFNTVLKARFGRLMGEYNYRKRWEETKNIKLSEADREYLKKAIEDPGSVNKKDLDAITERALKSMNSGIDVRQR